MVEDKVDAGAGRQGGELLQQLDRREEEMTRSVVPLALERDEDESIGRQGEALLRHRRAEPGAAEAVDARAGGGPPGDVCGGGGAPQVRPARSPRWDPRGGPLPAGLED